MSPLVAFFWGGNIHVTSSAPTKMEFRIATLCIDAPIPDEANVMVCYLRITRTSLGIGQVGGLDNYTNFIKLQGLLESHILNTITIC